MDILLLKYSTFPIRVKSFAMMLSAVIMGIFAVLGIKSLAVFGYIAIPSIVFLSLGTAARSVQTIGGWQNYLTMCHYNLSIYFQALPSLSVHGFYPLPCIADIMRYGKSKKDVITASTIGLLGGNTLMISCGGAIAGVAMNDGDLINVLLSWPRVPKLTIVDYKYLYHKWCEPVFHIIEP